MTLVERVLRLVMLWGGQHRYLSTGCLHNDHAYCDCNAKPDGQPKTARMCKHCPTRCVCHCHRQAAGE